MNYGNILTCSNYDARFLEMNSLIIIIISEGSIKNILSPYFFLYVLYIFLYYTYISHTLFLIKENSSMRLMRKRLC